jgi:hypothetical protein
MARRLIIGAALFLAACVSSSAIDAPVQAPVQAPRKASVPVEATLRALSALCGAEASRASKAGAVFTRVSGMGTGGFKVDTANPEAQAWFDYGLQLSHAFYHEDAKTAMKRASAADPSCALCAWGEAWVLGPTLNYRLDNDQRLAALAAANRARTLAKPGEEKALRLIVAIQARYAEAKTSTEPAFGQAMLGIAKAWPEDHEVAVLAAHALLIPVRAGDKSGLKPALDLLADVLKTRPDDTAAIHYFIHAAEFDGRAEDALAYADKLGRLAPAASHLVHMPAHTFFHAGRYEDAAVVNASAIQADVDWTQAGGDPRAPKAAVTDPAMYYAHNLAFGLAGALMSGDGDLALKYASHAEAIWPGAVASARGNPVPRTYVALARYAPDKAMALADLKGDVKFGIYRHYARGEVLLQRGDIPGARTEARAISSVEGAGKVPEAVIARKVIEARIAMLDGRPGAAVRLYGEAANLQDRKLERYMDPPAWWYPVRRSVAAAYLKAGDNVRAEAAATKSLSIWKHDPLALWVLAKAEAGEGKTADSAAHMAEARQLWRGDFDSITLEAI